MPLHQRGCFSDNGVVSPTPTRAECDVKSGAGISFRRNGINERCVSFGKRSSREARHCCKEKCILSDLIQIVWYWDKSRIYFYLSLLYIVQILVALKGLQLLQQHILTFIVVSWMIFFDDFESLISKTINQRNFDMSIVEKTFKCNKKQQISG